MGDLCFFVVGSHALRISGLKALMVFRTHPHGKRSSILIFEGVLNTWAGHDLLFRDTSAK